MHNMQYNTWDESFFLDEQAENEARLELAEIEKIEREVEKELTTTV